MQLKNSFAFLMSPDPSVINRWWSDLRDCKVRASLRPLVDKGILMSCSLIYLAPQTAVSTYNLSVSLIIRNVVDVNIPEAPDSP